MSRTRRIAMAGVLCALAFGLSYIEMLLPFDFAVPGIKLGLANVVVLVALYVLKPADAFAINFARVMLAGLLFGNPMTVSFSVAGAVFSFITMFLLKKYTGRHIIVISLAGAIAHIFGQMCVGMFYYNPRVVIYYCTFLLVAACFTGFLLGFVASRILNVVRTGFEAKN